MEAQQHGDQLKRGLKNRHIQLIALGGAIGTGLFIPVPTWLKFPTDKMYPLFGQSWEALYNVLPRHMTDSVFFVSLQLEKGFLNFVYS